MTSTTTPSSAASSDLVSSPHARRLWHLNRRCTRADTRGMVLAVGFLVGTVPFGLWTWLMVRADRSEHVPTRSRTPGSASVRTLPRPEATARPALVRSGSFCRVPGSIGFTASGATVVCTSSARGARPRWRRAQSAA